MSAPELIAVISSPSAPADHAGFLQGEDHVMVRRLGDLVAVYRHAQQGRSLQSLFSRGRRTAARRRAQADALLSRQRLLERLHDMGDVLPVLPGSQAPVDAAEVLLAANDGAIRSGLSQLRGRAQRQVILRWDLEAAGRRFADHPAADAGLAAVADALAGEAADRLAAAAEAVVQLPTDGPDMLLNRVLLGPREDPPELDAVLEAVDSVWTEGFSIRVIGPAPAISFCAARVRLPSAAELHAATRALGCDGPQRLAGVQQVEDAFRRRARAAGEAVARGGSHDLGLLQQARALLVRVAQARAAVQAAGLDAASTLPLVELHRDGEIAERRSPASIPREAA